MKSASTQRLYLYWQNLRGARAAPERRDIEPAAIKELLSDVFILEHDQGPAFNFRLAGSAFSSGYCRELKGRAFRHLWNEADLEALDTMLLAVREDAAAAVIGYEAINGRKQSLPFEMLLLPLRYGGDDFPRILGMSVPQDTAYWLGLHPVTAHKVTSMRLIWPDEQPAFLRQAVNAPGTFTSKDTASAGPVGLVDDDFDLDVREVATSQARADQRRQAFKVIPGGRDR